MDQFNFYLIDSIIAIVWATIKDENIGNYGYIGISILQIYRKYIDGYFEKKKYR